MERFPVRMIRADEPIKEPYTADELERLLKAPNKSTCSFAEYRNWVIVNFLLGTGCRASTLINLRIEDIDLSASTVLFRHMKARNQIVAPLTRRLGRLLEEYLGYRNETHRQTCYLFQSMERRSHEVHWKMQYGHTITNGALRRRPFICFGIPMQSCTSKRVVTPSGFRSY